MNLQEKRKLESERWMAHLKNPETGLTRMVEVGDKVEDSNLDVWKIISIEGNIAFYNKPLANPTKYDKYSCFIAKFADGTFNKIMTLRGNKNG